MIWRQ